MKCSTQATEEEVMPSAGDPCLCVFDIDRTLTAKQYTFKKGWNGQQQCEGTSPVYGAWDNGYGSGTLTLSQAAAQGGLANTSCSKCFVGICSHGSAGNWQEKNAIANLVLNTSSFEALARDNPDARTWNYGAHIPAKSPLAIGVPDRLKQWSVEGILAWYWSKGVKVRRERVWFFDDRPDNVKFFEGTNINSRQISCASRDSHIQRGIVGFCGARQSEITRIPGNFDCQHLPQDTSEMALVGNANQENVAETIM